MSASFLTKEIAREVLDPAGVADDAKAHITSSEQLIASFATRCAWPHLEHECLLSHPPIGAKAVSADNMPQHIKEPKRCWAASRYSFSKAVPPFAFF